MPAAPSRLPFALFFALASVACGGDESASEAPGLEGGDADLAWTAEEVYSLGGFEAIDWDAFGDVSGVGFDGDGNLYVLDSQAVRVHKIASSGELVRSFGSQGEGPGELNRPESMVVFPDGRVAVYDFGKFGWVRYDTEGEWIEDVTIDDPGTMQLLGNFSVAGGDAVFAEVVGEIRMNRGGGGEDVEAGGDGEAEESGPPVVRVALAEGAEATTVYRGWEPSEPEGPESEFSASSDAGNTMQIRMSPLRAFEPGLLLSGLPGGGFVVVDSTAYDVEIRDASGELVGAISRPIPPVVVTESIREAERGRRIAEVEEREQRGDQTGGVRLLGGGGAADLDMSGMNRMMRERIENMTFYPEIPVIEALATDPDGRVWIQRSSGEPGEDGPTDIVRTDQTYVGTLPADGIRTPDAFGPGGLAAWIETDEYDAQRIVVKRIVEGGGD